MRRTERVGQIRPEPVFQLVHERQEDGGQQRGGYPDRRGQQDQPQVSEA